MSKYKISRRTFLGAASAGLVVGFMPSIVNAQSTGRDFIVGNSINPTSLDPMFVSSNTSYRCLDSMFDRLVTVDAEDNFKLKPALALEWKRIDDNTLEFKLREGVKFHDGNTMTAEDVAFTFGPERLTGENPAYKRQRNIYPTLAKMEVVDDYTVRAITSEPDPSLLYRFSTGISGIISKAAYEASGSPEEFGRAAVGTGPFKARNFTAGDVIEMDVFDEYWGGKATVPGVVFREMKEVSARITALQTGEIDIAVEVPADQFSTIKGDPDLQIINGPISNYLGMWLDKHHPALEDPRIRQALSLAIDRKAIIDGLWDGLVEVPRGNQFPEYGDLFKQDEQAPAYDPETAKKLIKEAGYDGTEITYRTLNNYYTNEISTAQVLIQMWQAVGLKVRLEICENPDIKMRPEGRGIVTMSSTALFPDPVSALWRNFSPAAELQAKGLWSNEEFNELGKVLETSLDEAKRKQAYDRMQDIVNYEDPPIVILHFNTIVYGSKKSVDWTPTGLYMNFRKDNLSVS